MLALWVELSVRCAEVQRDRAARRAVPIAWLDGRRGAVAVCIALHVWRLISLILRLLNPPKLCLRRYDVLRPFAVAYTTIIGVFVADSKS